MKEGETTGPATPEPIDAATAIWGKRRQPKHSDQKRASSSDIWGSASAPPVTPQETAEEAAPIPDVWGDGGKGAPASTRERRPGSGRESRPAAYQMPPAWAATPKAKFSWRPRRRRP